MVSRRVTPQASQVPVNIVGGSQFGRYNKISAERTYNMFITTAGKPEGDDFEMFMVNFPGYQRILNFVETPVNPQGILPSFWPQGVGRGIFKSTRGDFAVAVINAQVYLLSSSFAVSLIGTLNTSSGEVFMAENLNSQICIVDGQNAWIYYYGNPAPSFTLQTGGPFTGALIPNYVEYHNSFFLFGNANTDGTGAFWYIYKFASSSTISFVTNLALQTKADFALAVKRLPGQGNNVMVFGSTVAEIWTQVGGLQEYIRNPTKNINYGCISVRTIGESGDVIAWLAANEEESAVIMTYDGNTLDQISTDGIDHILSHINKPELSTALFYRIDGHLLYQLTFYDKSDNVTIVYDFNTKQFLNLTDQFFNYHPARQIIYFNGRIYFISLNNAALYQLSSDIPVINENIARVNASSTYDYNLIYDLQKERITSSIREATSTRFIANSLVVTLEQGTDPNYSELLPTASDLITEDIFNPPDDDIITENGDIMAAEGSVTGTSNVNLPYIPRIELAISKDGGETWSNYVSRELHPLGHRQNILQWEGMGAANDICFKFRIWSRWRVVITNGLLDIVS